MIYATIQLIIATGPSLGANRKSHYLNQCWLILKWILGNKFQCNLIRNVTFFIHEYQVQDSICKLVAILSWSQWVKIVMTTNKQIYHIYQTPWLHSKTWLWSTASSLYFAYSIPITGWLVSTLKGHQPYAAIMGTLCDGYCEYFGGNWSCHQIITLSHCEYFREIGHIPPPMCRCFSQVSIKPTSFLNADSVITPSICWLPAAEVWLVDCR